MSTPHEYRLKVEARMKAIDLQRTGFISNGLYNPTIRPPKDAKERMEDVCIRKALAVGLLDGISSTEEGIAIRELNPELDLKCPLPLDLLTGDDQAVRVRFEGMDIRCPAEWRWPVWGFYEKPNEWLTLYSNAKESAWRVMIVYGFEALRPQTTPYVSQVKLSRNKNRVFDQLDLSKLGMENHLMILLDQPILYKRGDHMYLEAQTTAEAVNHCDHIKVLGVIAEPLSRNITGID